MRSQPRHGQARPLPAEVQPRRREASLTGDMALRALEGVYAARGAARWPRLECSPSCASGELCHGEELARRLRVMAAADGAQQDATRAAGRAAGAAAAAGAPQGGASGGDGGSSDGGTADGAGVQGRGVGGGADSVPSRRRHGPRGTSADLAARVPGGHGLAAALQAWRRTADGRGGGGGAAADARVGRVADVAGRSAERSRSGTRVGRWRGDGWRGARQPRER